MEYYPTYECQETINVIFNNPIIKLYNIEVLMSSKRGEVGKKKWKLEWLPKDRETHFEE